MIDRGIASGRRWQAEFFRPKCCSAHVIKQPFLHPHWNKKANQNRLEGIQSQEQIRVTQTSHPLRTLTRQNQHMPIPDDKKRGIGCSFDFDT